MTYEEALAICRANVKGSRDKEALRTARALDFLRLQSGKLSNREVGNLVDASGETVRQFLGLLRLPEAIQQLIDEKQLGLDKAHQLGRLRKFPLEMQLAAAEVLVSIKAQQARAFVTNLLATPEPLRAEVLARASAKRTGTEPLIPLVVTLPAERQQSLNQHAHRCGMSAAELAADILGRWLDSADCETLL